MTKNNDKNNLKLKAVFRLFFVPGGGVCGLLRAKGFPWTSRRISPAGHILVLVTRFDREFVPTFQGHGSVGGKNGTRFEMNFKACVSINELLRK